MITIDHDFSKMIDFKGMPEAKITIYEGKDVKFVINCVTTTNFFVDEPGTVKIYERYIPDNIYEIMNFIQSNILNENVAYKLEVNLLQTNVKTGKEEEITWEPPLFRNFCIRFSVCLNITTGDIPPGQISYSLYSTP